MNFIPKPRQRNDIAPFGFLTLFAFPMVVAEKVMCAIFKSFFMNAPLILTIKKRVRTCFNSLFLGTPRNLTTKKVMCAIRNAFVTWVSVAKKVMCALFNMFRDFFTYFLACFLGTFTAITAFGQIVTSRRKCLKSLYPPTFHRIQRILRNAGVLDDFNRKGITPMFLNRVVDSTTLRICTSQMIVNTTRQINISTDVLFATRRREDIDSGFFIIITAFWVVLLKVYCSRYDSVCGRDLALRRGS